MFVQIVQIVEIGKCAGTMLRVTYFSYFTGDTCIKIGALGEFPTHTSYNLLNCPKLADLNCKKGTFPKRFTVKNSIFNLPHLVKVCNGRNDKNIFKKLQFKNIVCYY